MSGVNKPSLAIADSDAIIALMSVNDAHYEKARMISQYCIDHDISIIFPTTAICEATAVLQKRLNNPQGASRVIAYVQDATFPLQAVDQEILLSALTLFNPNGSKQNTLFDAVIATLAKQLDADAIFSFDGWYRKVGLTLVSDFIEQEKAA